MRQLMALGLLVLAATPLVQAEVCSDIFNGSGVLVTADGSWRSTSSNLDHTGQVAATSATREKWIASAEKIMVDYLYGRRDTPEMVFAQAEGVSVKALPEAIQNAAKYPVPLVYSADPTLQPYHLERVAKIGVSGLGPNGILTGTLLLPVSGHTGIPNAEKWAKSDTYSIYLENSSGQKIATLADNVKSLDLITKQEISAQLTPGQVYRITYYRSGSGGPAGYSEGRIYEITWDGN